MFDRAFATLAAFGVSAALLVQPAASQDITGCLNGVTGTLYNVQIGSTPTSPCNPGHSTLTWNQVGPKGADGNDGADGAPGGGSAAFEFVGYSDGNTVLGNAGYVGLTQACDAEFPDIGARACTSEEFIKSTGLLYPTTDAWLLRTPIGVAAAKPGNSNTLTVIHGGYAESEGGTGGIGDCSRWTIATTSPTGPFNAAGMTVSVSGSISAALCNVSRPVTCCARAN